MSARLGTPFIPWQAAWADVAGEVLPETGLLAYRTVIATVPRQSGKTKLELAVIVHRCVAWPGQVATYTAQTRLKAREKWEDDHVKTLDGSPFRGMYRVRRTSGMEAVLWGNGSKHGIESTTEKAGHGDSLDLGVIDEAFAHTDARTEQAMRPAMQTRLQPQLWIVSTAGTEASVFLRQKVELGRSRCLAGLTQDVAYLEFSAPDDADPQDPATWWACMPGLGYLTGEDAVRADLAAMGLAEFRRAYLNQWVAELPAEWTVISREDWDACEDASVPRPMQVAVVADVVPGQVAASVTLAGQIPDGRMVVEVPEGDHRPGTGWVVPRLVDLQKRRRPLAVVIDPRSPAGSLIPEAERAGLEITKPSAVDVGQAFGRFFGMVVPPEPVAVRELAHLGQPDLRAAVAGAAKRDLGDGASAWARKSTAVDISPLCGATLAVWAAEKFGGRRYDVLKSVG